MSEELSSAGTAARAVVISLFDPATLPLLISEVERSIEPSVTVYLGSYGANLDLERQVNAAPNRIYGPMYSLQEGDWYWTSRHPLPGPEEKSPLARALPPLATILRSAQLDRLKWGIELGRRFRDQMRTATQVKGARICWQFDEIKSECARVGGGPWREFTLGILRGLHAGRSAEGDRSIIGIAWFAQEALRLTSQPLVQEMKQFWITLNRSTRLIVGEEYAAFRGPARVSARSFGQGHATLLAASDQLRRDVAARYVVGMTPGYNLSKRGLRGNLDHQPPSFVNRWRNDYLDERRRLRPYGFAQFDFTSENSDPGVIRDVIASLGRAVASSSTS